MLRIGAQAQLVRQRPDQRLVVPRPGGPGLDHPALDRYGVQPAAHPVPSLQDGHGPPAVGEHARRSQPGDTRPDHDDVTSDGHPGRLSIGPAPERRLTVITVSGISTTIARTARVGKLLATSNGPAAKAAVAPQRLDSASIPPWADARVWSETAALNSVEPATFTNDQPRPSRISERSEEHTSELQSRGHL